MSTEGKVHDTAELLKKEQTATHSVKRSASLLSSSFGRGSLLTLIELNPQHDAYEKTLTAYCNQRFVVVSAGLFRFCFAFSPCPELRKPA